MVLGPAIIPPPPTYWLLADRTRQMSRKYLGFGLRRVHRSGSSPGSTVAEPGDLPKHGRNVLQTQIAAYLSAAFFQ